MSAADEIDPMSSLYAWLAYDLRFHRQKRRLTGTQVGKIIGCVRSHVANLEAGRARIDMDQAKALDKEWGTGGHFQRLLWFARTAHDPDWFRQSAEFEARARVIRAYQGQVIPVPFQTEAYARAVLAMARVKDLDRALQSRMARQEELLGRDDPPLFVTLLDQDALDRPIGGPQVARAQLQQLLSLGELPNVILRAITRATGAHVGLNGPFQIMSLEKRDVAYIGAFHGGRLVQEPAEIRDLTVDFELIGAKALPEDATRILIEKLMEGYS
ncbi:MULTISPECIES: helix-turn-helix domain-containing protein [Thermomonosporaceae]|uniref:helix-turn-helix domain-containing protein n=1 Tax=Thermomonosporaceae TaxID=2012 RepID=UPI00255ABD00|nr:MULTISPECIES: helix-turn-helix transcriptional regulator [Thermomonosporaceae]MDL4774652.1 helix-turn-helix transcriptional regulator [Actinomadura xylanilytica]